MNLTTLYEHCKLLLNRFGIGLAIAVFVGAALRITHLGAHENPYYTATVASMLLNSHNFLFAAFDSAGIVMVDKPPVSLWIQAASAAVFGVNSFAVTFPQILVGLFAIVLLYRVIRPTFGRLAATVAAFVLAVIPVAVMIDSSNEPDSLLSFILLLAAIALIRAGHSGRWRWLLGFAVIMGIGFNIKMLAAFIPLPVFLMYYILVTKKPIRQTLTNGTWVVAVLAIISISWVALVGLTSPENRPYVGSTPDNSIQTLVLKYNGIDRFRSFIETSPRVKPSQESSASGYAPDNRGDLRSTPNVQAMNPLMARINSPPEGPLDLFSSPLANQLGWMLPLGLISLFLIVSRAIPDTVFRRPSVFRLLLQESPGIAQSLIWGGWLFIGLLVFGVASATTTHPYYLVGLAVPLAATIGIGSRALLDIFNRGNPLGWLVVAGLGFNAGYQLIQASPFVTSWVIGMVMAGALSISFIMILGLWRRLQNEPLANRAVVASIALLLVIPIAVSIASDGNQIKGPGLAGSQLHQPYQPAGIFRRTPLQPDFLSKLSQLEGYPIPSIILGTVRAREAAPFIISGIRSIAIGGFSGKDPIFTADSFSEFSEIEGPAFF